MATLTFVSYNLLEIKKKIKGKRKLKEKKKLECEGKRKETDRTKSRLTEAGAEMYTNRHRFASNRETNEKQKYKVERKRETLTKIKKTPRLIER